jgi:broad specificity phosphatase PhoE
MIYFIRHGESESNRDKVFAGRRADVELTEIGRQQAKDAGLQISKQDLDIIRVVSSPLKRTTETALIITKEINFPFEDVILDERLSEYDLGVITGKPIRELTAKEIVTAEGAEKPSTFLERIKDALDEYSVIEGNTLIVSHGGVSRMIKSYKEGSDINTFPDTPNYKNADLIELDWA